MVTQCEKCARVYDDAESDTGCPHYPLGCGSSVYCKYHDLFRPCQACGELVSQLPLAEAGGLDLEN
jgi:hypothetical protein